MASQGSMQGCNSTCGDCDWDMSMPGYSYPVWFDRCYNKFNSVNVFQPGAFGVGPSWEYLPGSCEDYGIEDSTGEICRSGGRCSGGGGFLSFSKQDSMKECGMECSQDGACKFFSYNVDKGNCLTYSGECEDLKFTGDKWITC